MTATRPRRVGIVGGGVGGLSLAVALHRAGIEPVVLETRQDAAAIESGGGFILWNNALRALAELGLAERLVPLGAVLDRVEWRIPDGTTLTTWPVADISRAVGQPALGITRRDLQSTLVAAVPDGALRLGTTCTGFTDTRGGVRVHLDGDEDLEVDALVGADGIRSSVRARLHGGLPDPRYAGVSQSFGLVDVVPADVPAGTFLEVDGPGLRFFTFPVGHGLTYWAAATRGAHRPVPRLPVEQEKERLLRCFGGWAEPVPALLGATVPNAIHRRDIVDRDPLARWGAGRATLLGDAAHPLTPNLGQGACQAIEDGVVLGRHLAGAADVEAALRSYEDARAGRTTSFVRRSRAICALGRWRNPLACAVRDLMTRHVVAGPALRRHGRDMAFEF